MSEPLNDSPAYPWRLAFAFGKWAIMEDLKPITAEMELRERDVPVIRQLVQARNLLSGAQTVHEAEIFDLKLKNAELTRALRNAERPFVLVNGLSSAGVLEIAGGVAAIVAAVLAVFLGAWVLILPIPFAGKGVACAGLAIEVLASYLAGFWDRRKRGFAK